MTTPATQFKLGLFVLIAMAGAAAVALGLGLRGRTEDLRYHTYFDESVSGLEVGSPVTFRGVRIGSVGAIGIAPDLAHVDVSLDIVKVEAEQLELATRARDLSTRLETQGITGVKFVDISPREARAEPPPELEFAPDMHYIPARPSLLFALEGQVERIGRQVPVLVDHATDTIDKLGRVFDDFHENGVAEHIDNVLQDTDAAVLDVRRFLQRIDRANLTTQARDTMASIDGAATKAKEVLGKLDQIDSLVASVRHAADSLGGLGRSASGSGELEQTIRDVGDAARALRELVEEIQRDPDMLVKGRARSKRP